MLVLQFCLFYLSNIFQQVIYVCMGMLYVKILPFFLDVKHKKLLMTHLDLNPSLNFTVSLGNESHEGK